MTYSTFVDNFNTFLKEGEEGVLIKNINNDLFEPLLNGYLSIIENIKHNDIYSSFTHNRKQDLIHLLEDSVENMNNIKESIINNKNFKEFIEKLKSNDVDNKINNTNFIHKLSKSFGRTGFLKIFEKQIDNLIKASSQDQITAIYKNIEKIINDSKTILSDYIQNIQNEFLSNFLNKDISYDKEDKEDDKSTPSFNEEKEEIFFYSGTESEEEFIKKFNLSKDKTINFCYYNYYKDNKKNYKKNQNNILFFIFRTEEEYNNNIIQLIENLDNNESILVYYYQLQIEKRKFNIISKKEDEYTSEDVNNFKKDIEKSEESNLSLDDFHKQVFEFKKENLNTISNNNEYNSKINSLLNITMPQWLNSTFQNNSIKIFNYLKKHILSNIETKSNSEEGINNVKKILSLIDKIKIQYKNKSLPGKVIDIKNNIMNNYFEEDKTVKQYEDLNNKIKSYIKDEKDEYIKKMKTLMGNYLDISEDELYNYIFGENGQYDNILKYIKNNNLEANLNLGKLLADAIIIKSNFVEKMDSNDEPIPNQKLKEEKLKELNSLIKKFTNSTSEEKIRHIYNLSILLDNNIENIDLDELLSIINNYFEELNIDSDDKIESNYTATDELLKEIKKVILEIENLKELLYNKYNNLVNRSSIFWKHYFFYNRIDEKERLINKFNEIKKKYNELENKSLFKLNAKGYNSFNLVKLDNYILELENILNKDQEESI